MPATNQERDIDTSDVREALDVVDPYCLPKWRVDQFRQTRHILTSCLRFYSVTAKKKQKTEVYIKDGIVRWRSNDLVPPRWRLDDFYEKKQISRAEYEKSLRALGRETAALVAEYHEVKSDR